jgi:NAD(P)H-dependent flavin oxidoreductase YrpB (nitropropane dioxygenase family)
MAPRTRLTEKLGIRHPVPQAPMGVGAGGSLAAAVSAAGGPGLVVWGGEAIDLIDAVEPAGSHPFPHRRGDRGRPRAALRPIARCID